MAEIPPNSPDAMAQTLSQIYASVQRMDKVVSGLARSVSAMESKLTRLQRVVARIDNVPEVPVPSGHDTGPDKRMTYLRNGTSSKSGRFGLGHCRFSSFRPILPLD